MLCSVFRSKNIQLKSHEHIINKIHIPKPIEAMGSVTISAMKP